MAWVFLCINMFLNEYNWLIFFFVSALLELCSREYTSSIHIISGLTDSSVFEPC